MDAAFAIAPRKVEIRDIEKPVIGDGDVLVKIHYAGVCGSDLHLYKGEHAFRKFPCIFGHEQSGEVCQIGKNVTRVKVGDRVTVNPQTLCGACAPCRTGLSNLCDHRRAPGTGDWIGTFAEYFPAPEETVFKLADHISYKAAVMTEPLAISHHLLKLGHANRRESIAILGSGTVGLTTLFLAKRLGYIKALCTDLSDGSLEISRAFGADVAVDPAEADVVEEALKMTDGLGVDLCVVTGASDDILDQASRLTRKGGDICLAAMITHPIPFQSYAFAQREQYLYGTLVYTTAEFEETVDIVSGCSSAELERFITQVVSFKDTQRAFEILEEKKEPVLKVLVELIPS